MSFLRLLFGPSIHEIRLYLVVWLLDRAMDVCPDGPESATLAQCVISYVTNSMRQK